MRPQMLQNLNNINPGFRASCHEIREESRSGGWECLTFLVYPDFRQSNRPTLGAPSEPSPFQVWIRVEAAQ